MTVRVVLLELVPPLFVQLRLYTYEPAVLIVPVVAVPLEPFEPLHEPPAVHDEGLLVAFQLIVLLLPVLIDEGLTEMLTTGTAMMVNVSDDDPVPTAFVQLSVYVLVPALLMTPVLALPLADLDPLQLPLAVHDVGLLVALHEIVALLPVPIDAGLTLIVTTGLADGPPEDTLTVVVALSLPPALEQDKV